MVDVGMHAKNMTREEAIKYMMANEPISEQGATAEIERYMAMPGQALAYKTGALKLREPAGPLRKAVGLQVQPTRLPRRSAGRGLHAAGRAGAQDGRLGCPATVAPQSVSLLYLFNFNNI
ncbi:DUF885 family protein [Hymenobacter humi]